MFNLLCYATMSIIPQRISYGCKAKDEEGQDLTFTTANNNTQNTTTGEFGCCCSQWLSKLIVEDIWYECLTPLKTGFPVIIVYMTLLPLL